MKVELTTVLEQAKGLLASEMDGEVVMMDVDQGRYFGLDPIGSRIWSLLVEPRSVAQVCDLLLPEFAVERARGEADVLAFCGTLLERRLVRIVEAG